MTSGDRYDAFEDPYAYKGTSVLKNRLGLRDSALLQAFELEMTALRTREGLPQGDLGVGHYRRLHRHLFQDVYSWAGRYRTVRTAKAGNVFCYPEYIAAEMDKLFRRLESDGFLQDLASEVFARRAAAFLGELNAIHPFREGNGRTQLFFLAILAHAAGHPADLRRLRPEPFLAAMIESFSGSTTALENELLSLLGHTP